MGAVIYYNPTSQKRGEDYFDKILTAEILTDITLKVTGQKNYTLNKIYSGYNKGRLLIIDYNDVKHYVTFSEIDNRGRNSNVQSVPTAINIFYSDQFENKRLHYYFLPHKGNLFSNYYLLYYRLIKTIGVNFLNSPIQIEPYISVEDIIRDRQKNSKSNRSNNSSFITTAGNKVLVYGKVFGANKYESTVLGLAAATVSSEMVEFYNICEQNLKELPKPSLYTFSKYKNIVIHNTSLFFEKKQYVENEDDTKLRSQSYLFNLYDRIGDKKCAFCDCCIPSIIHGAHIWNVSDIAKTDKLDREQKFNFVNSGNNGIWLCQNHHKLFDTNILMIHESGKIMVASMSEKSDISYIKHITTKHSVEDKLLSQETMTFLKQRNNKLRIADSLPISEL